MRLIAPFLALFTLLMNLGCAEQKPKGEAQESAQTSVKATEELFSTDEHKGPVVRRQSASLEVEIRVPENHPKTVKRNFRIDPALVSPPAADLELVLNGLPFQFPTRYEGDATWTVEFPENTLEILSKEGPARYSGTLHVKGAAKMDLRVQLVLKRETHGSAG